MKTSIKLAALFLLLSTGAFASAPSRFNHEIKRHDQVSLIPLHANRGFAVMVDKAEPGKSMVIVYDNDKNVIFKDRLTKRTSSEKKYLLSDLANGSYTVEIYSKNHDIKTQFYIYNRGTKRVVDII